MNVMELIRQNREYTVALRREFHQYPEVSWKEFRTTRRIREELDKLNIPNFDSGDPLHRTISALCEEGHRETDEERLCVIRKELDSAAAKLYGIGEEELSVIGTMVKQ